MYLALTTYELIFYKISAVESEVKPSIEKIQEIIKTGAQEAIARARSTIDRFDGVYQNAEQYSKILWEDGTEALHRSVELWRVNTFDTTCKQEASEITLTAYLKAARIIDALNEVKSELQLDSTKIEKSDLNIPFSKVVIPQTGYGNKKLEPQVASLVLLVEEGLEPVSED